MLKSGKKIIFSIITVVIAFELLCPDSAYAAGYLDPGSGSTIAQGAIAVIAGISRFFRKIKNFFSK